MKKKNYNKPSTSTAEQRRNKIYAIILACAMIFWTIASLLGTFAFARTLVGSAETATVREVERTKGARVGERFQEVDLHTSGITWAYDEVHATDPCFALADVSIRLYEDGVEFVVGGVDYFRQYNGEPYNLSAPFEFVQVFPDQDNVAIGLQLESVYINYEPSYQFEQPYGGNYRGAYVRRVNCSAYVLRVNDYFDVTYVYELMWYDIDGVLLGSDYLRLGSDGYDVYGGYVDIIYPYTSVYTFTSTTQTIDCGYWFTNYAHYYDNGYDVGSLDGYDVGYREGEIIGYQRGVEDAGDYTFFTLISAVVDAPIQAFTGLFNFDLLGVNLVDFFFALLTVATIIAVIRLFM